MKLVFFSRSVSPNIKLNSENWTVIFRLIVKIKYLWIPCFQPSRKNALASVILRSWLTFAFKEPFKFFGRVTQPFLQHWNLDRSRPLRGKLHDPSSLAFNRFFSALLYSTFTGWIILIGSLLWILNFCDGCRQMQLVASDNVMCPWAHVIIERRASCSRCSPVEQG